VGASDLCPCDRGRPVGKQSSIRLGRPVRRVTRMSPATSSWRLPRCTEATDAPISFASVSADGAGSSTAVSFRACSASTHPSSLACQVRPASASRMALRQRSRSGAVTLPSRDRPSTAYATKPARGELGVQGRSRLVGLVGQARRGWRVTGERVGCDAGEATSGQLQGSAIPGGRDAGAATRQCVRAHG
jgi:hypothetical protein